MKYLHPLRMLVGVTRRAEAWQARRIKSGRRARANSFFAHASFPVKANVGCGNEPFQGWVNLDVSPGARADILWDVTDGLPFPDDSCAFIYSEHFLEHFPVHEGVRFLAECRRSLQSGGVVRIGMPSAKDLTGHYYEDVWARQPWLQKYGYTRVRTGAEYINVCFRDWGHQWLYDFEELDRRLGEAGFTQIETASWGESKYPELRNRETRAETTLICEATK